MFATSASNPPPPPRFKSLVVLLATGSSTQRDWSRAEADMSLSRACPCTESCGLFYKDRGLASTRTKVSCAGSNLSRSRLNMDSSGGSWHSRLLWEESCPGGKRSSSGTTVCPGHKHFCTVRATLQDLDLPRGLSRGLVQDRAPRLLQDWS